MGPFRTLARAMIKIMIPWENIKMATHGGRRDGAGRKRGSLNKPKLQLASGADATQKAPTAAQRTRALKRQVALCVADGMDEISIGAVLGLDVAKLRVLFAHELAHGSAIVRAEMLARLAEAGDAGNVAAQKALLAVVEPVDGAGGDVKPSNAPDRVVESALRLLQGGKTP